MEFAKIPFFNKAIESFRKDVSDIFEYKFKCLNEADFSLILEYKAKSRVLRGIFAQVRRQIGKDEKFKALYNSDPQNLKSFEVPPQFNGRVHTAVLKNINAVAKRVKKNANIILTRTHVDKCVFYNEGEETKIIVHVGGIYAR
jgi:hypothetical protein